MLPPGSGACRAPPTERRTAGGCGPAAGRRRSARRRSREQRPAPRHALELVHAARPRTAARSRRRCRTRSPRRAPRPAPASVADARGDVDGHAADVVADQLALAGVQPDAHLEPERHDGARRSRARSGAPGSARRRRRSGSRRRGLLTSRPSKRSISRRTAAWWSASRSRQRASPSARRVAGRADDVGDQDRQQRALDRASCACPVRNSSISATSASVSPTLGRLSMPSSST